MINENIPENAEHDINNIKLMKKEIEALRRENAQLNTQLEKAETRIGILEILATKDELTGVFNRRGLDEELGKAIKHSRRHKESLGLLMLDLDFFKEVNDKFGHLIGDDVLIQFTAIVERNIRQEDILGRFGGEEFLIVLPNTLSEGAHEIAERVRKKIKEGLGKVLDPEVEITTSIGLAQLDERDTKESIIKKVDIALYQAKMIGRNKTVIWESTT